ncbi:hypothetical protein HHI36_013528 [Cryptolaemus montrouzieri]|uniref:Uncharacterized protein n=1 Tax=Cryptolaemus montrouzieri TaxID=559131 RepID=A0ABD2NI37_9CUCU
MTESDDYDFSSTENSTLSRLFEKDGNHGSGVSNLIYKAPKQPLATESKTPKNSTTKFFFKYINLYEIIGVNHQLFGKHIIALITSEANGSEMLIYQSKKIF